MRKVVIVATPSLHNVVMMEPFIEAVYYKYSPCEIHLITYDGYFPFFEHHPLITALIPYKVDVDFSPLFREEERIFLYANDPDASTLNAPVVEKFALVHGLRLTRKTPKIFLEEYPKDSEDVIHAVGIHRSAWPELDIPGAVLLENPKTVQDTREALKQLAGASLVVGPDGWMTQAAAALDARVLIGMEPEDEAFRCPFNAVATPVEPTAIMKNIYDITYEKRYPNYMNEGNAAEWIKEKAKRYLKSNFVDVGCSSWPIPNGIPVDMRNREVIEEAPDEMYSGVFSSHCLEHIKEWEKELALWHRIIRPGGIMFLYLPHPRCEVWHAHTGSWVGRNHVWNPEPVTLVKHLTEVLGMQIVEYTSRRDSLWSFTIIARKTHNDTSRSM